MKLYLIRHAQSTANVRHALDTKLPGPPLTDLGHEQARSLAAQLVGQPIAAVYASQAVRAQQTAVPLATERGQELQVAEGVQEVFVGDLEGRSDQEAIQRYLETVRPWLSGDLSGSMPGGESGEQVRARYLDAVAQLRARHEDADDAHEAAVALFSHGGVIRLGADWLADNVRPEVADAGLLPNTGVVELETRPNGGWTCLHWAGVAL